MAPATKPPNWRNSKEKKLLYEDISNGDIAGMPPKQVYNTRDGIYHKFKYTNFRTNLNNLRKRVATDRFAADRTQKAYDHDKPYFTKPENLFVWNLSNERKLLSQDVRDGKVDGKKPRAVRASRDEYKDIPLTPTKWRDFLWQEKGRYAKEQRKEELKEIVQMKSKGIF